MTQQVAGGKKMFWRVVPVALAAGAAVVLFVWGPLGGCRNLQTRIAQRTLYDAAGPLPASTTSPASAAPAGSFSAAEDWPAWRGPRGDGISREAGLAESWPAGGPEPLWSAEVGLGFSSPVAAAGRVYLFSLDNGKEALTAFDAASGRILWNDEADGAFTRSYAGTRSTPAVDGDAVYTFGGAGDLIRRDLPTGKPRWRANVLQEAGAGNLGYGTSSSPLVAGGLVYVQGGAGGPVALAFHKDTGRLAWKSQALGTAGYAHPLLADVAGTPHLIVLGGEAVYGMDPLTGKTLWSVRWPTDYQVNSSTPVYSAGHLFVTSAYGQGCMMLALSPVGPTKLWQNKEIQSRFQGTILDESRLYANSEGTVKCMSWPDGAILWSAKESKLRLGFGGSLVRVGDKLLMMSDRGKLSLARTTDAGLELLGQAAAFDANEIWSTPLIYGGRLYAKGAKELICFELSTRKKN